MTASDQGVKSPAAPVRNQGGDDHKEILHHQVRGPGRLQIRQAVKNIEHIAFAVDQEVIYGHGESFKPMRKGNMLLLHHSLRHQPLVGEMDIDDFHTRLLPVLYKRGKELLKLPQIIDLPDDIVQGLFPV